MTDTLDDILPPADDESEAPAVDPPELLRGVPIDQYHQRPEISLSQLKDIGRSPLHFWWRHLSGQAHKPDSDAMRLGRAIHCWALEPDLIDRCYGERLDGRTKAGRAQREAVESGEETRELLSPAQWEAARGTARALAEHPGAATLLSGEGLVEASIIWTDPETGVRCRCRPDWWRDRALPADLKCVQDASRDGFRRAVRQYGWHAQAAFYSDGIEALTGEAPAAFVFAAVETSPPHAVGLWQLPQALGDTHDDRDPTVEEGRALYRGWLDKYARCLAAGEWPGYGEIIQTL